MDFINLDINLENLDINKILKIVHSFYGEYIALGLFLLIIILIIRKLVRSYHTKEEPTARVGSKHQKKFIKKGEKHYKKGE